MNFVAQSLARRCGIAGEVALDELLSGSAKRIMSLLRMGLVPRETAAALLAAIGDLLGVNDPGRALGEFDSLTDEDVASSLNWLSSDPIYQAAVAALRAGDGQRSV